MQESTAVKIKNMIHNITEGYIAPVEIIAKKYNKSFKRDLRFAAAT